MAKKTTIDEKRKRKRKALLILLLSTAVLAIVAFVWSLMASTEQSGVASYVIYLTVGNYTGFNVNNTALYFGTLTPGASATRFVVIKNDDGKPLEAFFTLEGDVADFISVSESIVLGAYQNTTVEIEASVPATAAFGNYNGTLRIISRRVQ